MRPLEVIPLRRWSYRDAHEKMRELTEARAEGLVPDTLFLVEHDAVYTAGRRSEIEEELLSSDIEVVEIERGGRITYHGPGQLVAYPIVALEGKGRDLHAWLRLLEDVVIDTLAAHGLEGTRDSRGTGVFTSGQKIASIGIAVRRWVTWHGLALNVSTDLDAFRAIRPCGFDADLMTSLEGELGSAPPLPAVAEALTAAFQARLRRYPGHA